MDGHVALTTPLSGAVCCRYRLGHATVNLATKFEVPIFTVTEISNALQNVENGVFWGG